MKKIDDLINQLESKVPYLETFNPKISTANVGWHIEHSLLTINRVTNSLIHSDPKDYQWKFNLMRVVVLTMKKITRASVKAPAAVQPKRDIDKNHLLTHIASTRTNIHKWETLSKGHYFEHPFLGKLTQKQTIRFLLIHTEHHLHIMDDILTQ